MRLHEAVRLALAQIRVQKLKSFFTLVGVAIGVMFLIASCHREGMGRTWRKTVGKIIAKGFEVGTARTSSSATWTAEWRSGSAGHGSPKMMSNPAAVLSPTARWSILPTTLR
jgi:hypothetical protein